MKNEQPNRGGRTEHFCFNARRTAACNLIHQTKLSVHSVTDLGQNTIQDAFYLPGRGSPEPTQWPQRRPLSGKDRLKQTL